MSVYGKHVPNCGYIPGDNWVECERCGHDIRASNMRTEWTGALVCVDCWETRHPQDFVRGIKEKIIPDVVNPPTPVETLTTSGDTNRDIDEIPTSTFGNYLED